MVLTNEWKEPTMKDYALEIKVKNNYLLTKMRQHGILTLTELSKETGINRNILYGLAGLKITAITKNGRWRQCITILAAYFNCMPEELVPSQHIDKSLPKNSAVVEIGQEDLGKIAWAAKGGGIDPLLLVFQGEAIDGVQDALSHLKPRERHVITMRYGLDGEPPATLDDVAKTMEVTRERVRQIEAKGIRRLKHPATRLKFDLDSHMQTFDDVAGS